MSQNKYVTVKADFRRENIATEHIKSSSEGGRYNPVEREKATKASMTATAYVMNLVTNNLAVFLECIVSSLNLPVYELIEQEYKEQYDQHDNGNR